jgi:hypothetical protein
VSPSRYDVHGLAGGLTAAWRSVVHHIVHPISGTIVLTAAAIEVFEWAHVAIEQLTYLMEVATGPPAG